MSVPSGQLVLVRLLPEFADEAAQQQVLGRLICAWGGISKARISSRAEPAGGTVGA